jgi:glycosyltransferase involved in cell wall biosynthesis
MPGTAKDTVLFISYDGMTDQLGQSQILPYLFGISASDKYDITLLSFEKKNRLAQHGDHIRKICTDNNIDWQLQIFHTQPPILAKYYDLYNMKRKAFDLYKKKKFKIIHCRSYLSIEIGLALKEKFGCKVLFDMRGFWVDERVDGGLWDLNKPLYRTAYKSYKKKENHFITHSDHIISLTKAGENEMKKWDGYNAHVPITVIPCAADFDVFSLVHTAEKAKARERLGFSKDDLVLSYLGSLGTWYLLDEMLDFFKVVKQRYANAKFLFLTAEPAEMIYNKVKEKDIDAADIKVMFAKRDEVALLTKSSDMSLCFIKQAYSKLASSPTKLGELLAMGIPVICNGKIGDVEEIISMTGGGLVLQECKEPYYSEAVKKLPEMLTHSPSEIRAKAERYYDLKDAVHKYLNVYDELLNHD